VMDVLNTRAKFYKYIREVWKNKLTIFYEYLLQKIWQMFWIQEQTFTMYHGGLEKNLLFL